MAERWAGFILSLQSVEETGSRSVQRLSDTLKTRRFLYFLALRAKPSRCWLWCGHEMAAWLPDDGFLMFRIPSSEKGQGDRLSLPVSFLYEGNMFP